MTELLSLVALTISAFAAALSFGAFRVSLAERAEAQMPIVHMIQAKGGESEDLVHRGTFRLENAGKSAALSLTANVEKEFSRFELTSEVPRLLVPGHPIEIHWESDFVGQFMEDPRDDPEHVARGLERRKGKPSFRRAGHIRLQYSSTVGRDYETNLAFYIPHSVDEYRITVESFRDVTKTTWWERFWRRTLGV